MKKTLKRERRKHIVIQKNDLLKGNYKSLTTTDIKIFKFLISMVNSQNTLFEDFYFFTNTQIEEYTGIKNNNIHQIILQSLRSLSSVFVVVEDNELKRKEVGLIKNEIEYYKGSGRYCISFNNDLVDYLLNITDSFTQYNLVNIKSLNKREIKLFEYLRMVDFKEFEINIYKLREIMELGKSYEQFFNFKKVFDQSIKKINETTSLKIEEVEYIKSSKTGKKEKVRLIISRSVSQRIEYKNTLDDRIKRLIGKDIFLEEKYWKIVGLNYDKSTKTLKYRLYSHSQDLVGTQSKVIEDLNESITKFENYVVRSV